MCCDLKVGPLIKLGRGAHVLKRDQMLREESFGHGSGSVEWGLWVGSVGSDGVSGSEGRSG